MRGILKMTAGSVSRFVFAVSAALAAAISGDFFFLIIVLLALLSAFISWGGNFKDIFNTARVALIFFLLVFILHLFAGSGKTLFGFWILRATYDGAAGGLLYGLKLVLFVYSAYIIFFKVDPVELVNPVERLAKHAGPLGKYLSGFAISFYLALRFLPDLSRLARTTLLAFRSRGINLEGNLADKARVINMLVVSIFVGAFKKADSVTAALSVKGYSTRYYRAVFPPPKLRIMSILMVAVSICLVISGWYSR
jgi:energy-coupling factor transporter transmembrane protein EcfT